MPPRSLRDLLPALPPNPTLHDVVAANPPLEGEVTAFETGLVAALPGDDISQHPAYVNFANNRFRGRNPQEVLRLLKDGSLETQAERKEAMEWIRTCERCGEKIRAYREDG